MSVPPEVVEVAQRWVDKAEHDCEAATRIMAVEGGCPYDTVCFHCQQVVEKYLKALLTLAGFTHLERTIWGWFAGCCPSSSTCLWRIPNWLP